MLPPPLATCAAATRLGLILAAVALLTLAGRIAIPFDPVPITLQTLAVTLIGALLGWRIALAAILVWLALGAAGLPLLADGASGIGRFAGPTAGYLAAFPIAGALTGLLGERGWTRSFRRALALMLIGNALCVVIGAAWLAAMIGPAKAWAGGVLPFLPGALLKSLAGAAIVFAIERRSRARS